jgi:pSer/pThr/pTyr-binding forkhead associated (FHA) protein
VKYPFKAQLNAKNGMLVNNQPATPAALNDGDVIRVGDTDLLFLATDQVSNLNGMIRSRVWSKQSTAQTVKGSLPK